MHRIKIVSLVDVGDGLDLLTDLYLEGMITPVARTIRTSAVDSDLQVNRVTEGEKLEGG